MSPSEKERIIEEGFDAIRKVYNLRDDLLSDAGKLEAAKESNRRLSDRVANLEVTIKTLNSAIDKKDTEIRALKATSEALERNRDSIYDKYLELCHVIDADEELKKRMIADNRKKKDEIKRLKEELEAEKKIHCCDKCVCSVKKEYELLRKAHAKLCSDYDTLSKTTVTKESFHELRQRLSKLYLYHVRDMLQTKDLIAFENWFTETFGYFGVYDEE